MISSNSFCGIIFTRAKDLNLDLRTAIPVQLFGPKKENNLVYYSEIVEFYTKKKTFDLSTERCRVAENSFYNIFKKI